MTTARLKTLQSSEAVRRLDQHASAVECGHIWLEILAYRPENKKDALKKLHYIAAVVVATTTALNANQHATLLESLVQITNQH